MSTQHQLREPATAANEADVRAQLQEILSSQIFRNSEQLSRFLRFAVEHTLLGEGDQLKEYRIGVDVFGRPASYDPRIDPVVRLEARRLRAKLQQYYQGEGASDSIRIEMPKGGYAISIAAPPEAEPASQIAAGQSSVGTPSRRFPQFLSRAPGLRWSILAAIVLVVVAAAALYRQHVRTSLLRAEPPSLAILPFINLTGNPDNDYLSDGLTDELTGAIAKSAGLRVVARTSAFQFKGKSEDVRAIGKRLNVSSILEGSVQSQGSRMRITAQLIRTMDGYHLWSDTYEREFKDAFAVEDQITWALSDALSARLLANGPSNANRDTADPVAHDLYLRGQYMRQRFSLDDVKKAMDYFNQAIDHDPLYSEAYAALAAGYAVQGANIWADPAEVYPKARAAAKHAIELDPNQPDAHAILGNITFFYDWDFPGAEREFKRALQLNPNSAAAHQWLGILLYYSRRFEQAREQFRLAKELNPLAIQIDLTMVMLYAAERKYDAAIELDRKVLREHDNAVFHGLLGLLYADKKQYNDATAEAQKAIALSADPGMHADTTLVLANVYAQSGQRDRALSVMRQLLADKKAPVLSFSLAGVYAELGDKEQMYQWLDRCIEQRSPACLKVNIVDFFDPYRTEPRFQEIVRKLGLPQ